MMSRIVYRVAVHVCEENDHECLFQPSPKL